MGKGGNGPDFEMILMGREPFFDLEFFED